MTDYTELVEDLRDIEKTMFALGTSSIKMDNVSIRLAYDKKWGRTAKEAADAIEALIGTVGDLQAIRERLEEENDALRLEPKRGEIVRCGECRWGHLCVMGQHLGLDGFCSKGEREVQDG